jgi:hypothetical protein
VSVVYFISGGSCIKIGTSTNVKSRFASLQTSSMDELRLLGTIPGDVEREREVHASLERYRKRGEWFIDCSEVRQAIVELCGRDVFEAVQEPPQPTPPRPLREILEAFMENTKERFSAFSDYCLENCDTNRAAKVWRLHVAKRHLVVAAISHAARAIDREENNFILNRDDIDAVGRAAASAECCECHIEMIVADDAWFLEGWQRAPRVNPLFETLNGKPRWKTREEAYADGWSPPKETEPA